jgi:hypothetical protein
MQAIRDYVEMEAPDERVVHLERVKSERVFQHRHDVWDVHTDKDRWWVVTPPTNFYRQQDFPSLDYVLSFHIGLMARVIANKENEAETGPWRGPLLASWRKWEQAAEALNEAEEAEDFQAVGMRCRECLLALIRAAADPSMLAPNEAAPKRGDFIGWSEIVARAVAHGSSSEEVRSYLKTVSKAGWQLANWLTHSTGAVRADGQLAKDATQHLLDTFSLLLLRHEHGVPDRCPECGSYQVGVAYSDRLITGNARSAPACTRCGWQGPFQAEEL